MMWRGKGLALPQEVKVTNHQFCRTVAEPIGLDPGQAAGNDRFENQSRQRRWCSKINPALPILGGKYLRQAEEVLRYVPTLADPPVPCPPLLRQVSRGLIRSKARREAQHQKAQAARVRRLTRAMMMQGHGLASKTKRPEWPSWLSGGRQVVDCELFTNSGVTLPARLCASLKQAP
jgi:hypothetical protein